MRKFLQLKSTDEVSLKRETVSLSDIEYASDKIIKALLSKWNINCQMNAAGVRRTNPTANEEVKKELTDIYMDLGHLTEVDWSKVRDMTFNENRALRRAAIDKIARAHCLECPNFLEHVQVFRDPANFSTHNFMKNISSDKRLRI
jgi:antiviral helicase SKI2